MMKPQPGPNNSPERGPNVPQAAPIIHINGWAGSGKLTIARALAHLTGAQLLDNHTLLNPALALFGRGTLENRALRQTIRDAVFAAATALPPGTPLILTDAFSDDPYEQGLFTNITTLAQARNSPLIRVILDIDLDENIARLTQPSRANRHKLTDPNVLRDNRKTLTLLGANTPNALHLDVTALSPQHAAELLSQMTGLAGVQSGSPSAT